MRDRAVALACAGLLLGAQAATASAATGLNSSVRASPIALSLSLAAATTRVGDSVQAQAVVSDLAPYPIKQVVVELRADVAGLRIKPSTIQVVQLKPGKSTAVKWTLCASAVGTYVVLARATGDRATVDSQAQLLTVQPGGRRSCP